MRSRIFVVVSVGVVSLVTTMGVGWSAAAEPKTVVRSPAGTPPTPFGHPQFILNVADPEASIPPLDQRNANPLQFGYFLQDLLDRAAEAAKQGDTAAAIRYQRAIARAVPERALAFSRLCALYESTGQRQAAIEACRGAVDREGVVIDDYIRYVRLLLGSSGAIAKADADEVRAVVAHLRLQPGTAAIVADLQRQFISRVGPEVTPTRWTARLADWRFTLALAVAVLGAAISILTVARARRDQQNVGGRAARV
jgi:hypothetical protein